MNYDDNENKPLTPEDFRRMRSVPRCRTIRRALGLTQAQFAKRYGIPLGTLRDWEQMRTTPDKTAMSYLKVIALNSNLVTKYERR